MITEQVGPYLWHYIGTPQEHARLAGSYPMRGKWDGPDWYRMTDPTLEDVGYDQREYVHITSRKEHLLGIHAKQVAFEVERAKLLTLRTPTPPAEPDDRLSLWLHLVSMHSIIVAPDLTLLQLQSMHEAEHDGPGTIRNHPREDRSAQLRSAGRTLIETE